MKIHFVHAGPYESYDGATRFGPEFSGFRESRLRSLILEGMQENGIKKVMMTNIYMWRSRLITYEKMENFCKGEEDEKESVNDDLDSFFEDICLGEEPEDEALAYFLPKLTRKELKLVERKDSDFMHTFLRKMDADVNKTEMKLSESDSKFVLGFSVRNTLISENAFDSLYETETTETTDLSNLLRLMRIYYNLKKLTIDF